MPGVGVGGGGGCPCSVLCNTRNANTDVVRMINPDDTAMSLRVFTVRYMRMYS